MKPNPVRTLAWLLPIWFAAGLIAQEKQGGDAAKTTSKPSKSAKAGSASSRAPRDIGSLFGGPVKEGVDGELQQLHRDYMRALFAYHRARADKLRESGKQLRSFAFGPVVEVTREFAPRFMAAARKYKGKDDAMPFLSWCLYADRTPGNVTTAAAFEALLQEPLSGRKCAETISQLAQARPALGEKFAPGLEDILKQAKSDEVKAAALFARAESHAKSKGKGVKDTAIADYRAALALAPKAKFADAARGALNGLTILQVGMPAPEITGQDLDGVTFRLSDYRGKVVMLSFWGDW